MPKTIYLKNYRKPDFGVTSVNLTIDFYDDKAIVTNTMQIFRSKNANAAADLILDGLNQELHSVSLNGKKLENFQYTLSKKHLTIRDVGNTASVEIISQIVPKQNFSLEGLYHAGDNLFLTQCEAEGFRKITYFLDRPDVMTEFTTKIIADKKYPVLLSNGDIIDQGTMDNERHFVTWHDKSKKPCYLFALVIGGDLAVQEDNFITKSGKKVAIKFYANKKDLSRMATAIAALKASMQWDEEVFKREYDLNTYMVVATPKFNMGAMENKGLNIFNDKYMLFDKDTATDRDYQLIYRIIGHEYFHNWTGNRITLRDWFQLSLKEGLTVFREQEFGASMFSPTEMRIDDVNIIESAQFAEDSGPLAHPVRPSSYAKIDNFYTTTVYDKGAEVIRMLQTILGKAEFLKGIDLYFARHDGEAVTCEDFISAMENANKVDLTQFKLWYSQSGTPILAINSTYDSKNHTYTLIVKQINNSTADQKKKQPLHIPVKVGLLHKGNKTMLAFTHNGKAAKSHVLDIKNREQKFVFENIEFEPLPSLLQDFSAPVKIQYPYKVEDLELLFRHDNNGFNKWHVSRKYYMHWIKYAYDSIAQHGESSVNFPESFNKSVASLLKYEGLTKFAPEVIARTLCLPTMHDVYELITPIDPELVHNALTQTWHFIGYKEYEVFLALYNRLADELGDVYETTNAAMAKRSLKNICLTYLVMGYNGKKYSEGIELAHQQAEKADNMTDRLAALTALMCSVDSKLAEPAMHNFYKKWHHEELAVNKWLAIQAKYHAKDACEHIERMLQHEAFDSKTPNKVYALLGAFSNHNYRFHAQNGKGYKILTDMILKIDQDNAHIAAGLARVFSKWHKLAPVYRDQMQQALQRINIAEKTSEALQEMVTKMLAN